MLLAEILLIIFLLLPYDTLSLSNITIQQNYTLILDKPIINIAVDGINGGLYLFTYNYQNNQQQVQYYNTVNVSSSNQTDNLTPQTIYILPFSNQTYEQILQIENTYLIFYSQIITNYNIFFLNGTYYFSSQKNLTFNQILYSNTQSEIYILYQTGILEIISLENFIDPFNQNSTLVQFPYNVTIKGILSPDQSMLVLYSQQINHVVVYNLVNKSLIVNTSIPNINILTWHTNSQSLYIYNYLNNSVYQIQIFQSNSTYIIWQYLLQIPIIDTNLTLPINQTFISQLLNYHKFIYIPQTDQLLLVIQILPLSELAFFTFNFYDLYFKPMLNIALDQENNSCFDIEISGQNMTLFTWNSNDTDLLLSLGNISYFSNATASNGTGGGGGGGDGRSRLRNQRTNKNSTIIKKIKKPRLKSKSAQTYQAILNSALDNPLLNALNKFPGSRKYCKPMFYFFGNFDDLWLYYYHQRSYSVVVQTIFLKIRQLQTQKWQLINFQAFWQTMVPFSQIKQIQNYFNTTAKIKFTSPKYLLIQNQSTSYLQNTLNFYFENLIFIIITFILGNVLLRLSTHFNLRIKTFFIQFKFMFYLVILSLQGNVQFMSYLFGFQMKAMVKSHSNDIYENSYIIIHNFIFVFLVLTMYFFIQNIYKQNSLKLEDNFRNLKYTCFYFTLQSGIRNIILGLAHIMISQNVYLIKIITFLLLQICFLSLNIFIVNKHKIFTQKTRIWINNYTTLLRMFFIGLFLPKFISQDDQLQYLEQDLYITLIYGYLFLWIMSIINEIVILGVQIYELVRVICNKGNRTGIKVINDGINRNKAKLVNLNTREITNESLVVNKKVNYKLMRGVMNRQSILTNQLFQQKLNKKTQLTHNYNQTNQPLQISSFFKKQSKLKSPSMLSKNIDYSQSLQTNKFRSQGIQTILEQEENIKNTSTSNVKQNSFQPAHQQKTTSQQNDDIILAHPKRISQFKKRNNNSQFIRIKLKPRNSIIKQQLNQKSQKTSNNILSMQYL